MKKQNRSSKPGEGDPKRRTDGSAASLLSAERIVSEVRKLGLEGVIGKRRNSKYKPGERSDAWVKLRLSPEQEFCYAGIQRGAPLESLVVGYYEGDWLMCAGKVRQDLNPRNRRELAEFLKPMHSRACPFANLPNSGKSHWGEGITAEQMNEIQWVKPKIVVQVSFTEWTAGGNLRHGAYKGIPMRSAESRPLSSVHDDDHVPRPRYNRIISFVGLGSTDAPFGRIFPALPAAGIPHFTPVKVVRYASPPRAYTSRC